MRYYEWIQLQREVEARELAELLEKGARQLSPEQLHKVLKILDDQPEIARGILEAAEGTINAAQIG